MTNDEILRAAIAQALHKRKGDARFLGATRCPPLPGDARPLHLLADERRVGDRHVTDLVGGPLQRPGGPVAFALTTAEPFRILDDHWPSMLLKSLAFDSPALPKELPARVTLEALPEPTTVLLLNDPGFPPAHTDAGTLRFVRLVVIDEDDTRPPLPLARALLEGDPLLESPRPAWASDDAPTLDPGHAALNDALDADAAIEPVVLRGPLTRLLDPSLALDWVRVDFVDRPDGAHWRFTTYGLSDLHEKTNDDPAVSGLGYELTIRVAGTSDFRPDHVGHVLWSIAEIARGHASGADDLPPIALGDASRQESGTGFGGLLVTEDVLLDPIVTPFGRVRFRQLVGLSRAAYETALHVGHERYLAALHAHGNPLLLCESQDGTPGPAVDARALEAAVGREPSPVERRPVESLSFATTGLFTKSVTLATTPTGVATLARMVPLRLAHGLAFTLEGPERAARFEAGQVSSFRIEGETLVVTLAKDAQSELSYADDRRPPGRLARFGKLTILFAG